MDRLLFDVARKMSFVWYDLPRELWAESQSQVKSVDQVQSEKFSVTKPKMWKLLCVSVLLAQLVVGAKMGLVIGPMASDGPGPAGDSLPLFGSFFVSKYAKIAREVVHNSSEWLNSRQTFEIFGCDSQSNILLSFSKDDTMLATIATTKPLKGYPMVDSLDVADSKWNESSTGNINFYLQKSDPLFANIKKKNAVSVIFSNETTQYNNETAQIDTLGYRVLITGSVAQVKCLRTLNFIRPFRINRHFVNILDSSQHNHVQWHNGCPSQSSSRGIARYGSIEHHSLYNWNRWRLCDGQSERSILCVRRRLL